MTIVLRWLKDEREIRSQLNKTSAEIIAALKTQLLVSMGELREYIVESKLTGALLHQRTGNLINSTQPFYVESGTILSAGVAVGREAPYGAYQEYGASIPERVPIRAKALHWLSSGGADVFAKRARAFTLPSRSFMRSSFSEQRDKIIADLGGAINRVVKSGT